MTEIKFYSENDFAYSGVLTKIIEKVNSDYLDSKWDINVVIEFHNLLKYIRIKRFREYIQKETGIDIILYEKLIKQKMGTFFGIHKNTYLNLYDEINLLDAEDFFEIMETFKIYESFELYDFEQFLEKENVYLHNILKCENLVIFFGDTIKAVLLSDCKYSEIIISIYLGENEGNLPRSLKASEVFILIDEYIDSSFVNLNVLRKIVTFPTNGGLDIPDKIKLHAKKKANVEEERIFSKSAGIESGFNLSYVKDQNEFVKFQKIGTLTDIKISINWIEDNLDYPTLLNNFIYVYNYVDITMRLAIDSKINDMGIFERTIRDKGKHLYNNSFSFNFIEKLSDTEIISYSFVLNNNNIRLEEIIEWFYTEYLKNEFNIKDFIVKMPAKDTSYFEKCRTILPEIDRMIKQYHVLLEDGAIDQELIQMSSSSVKFKDVKSLNEKKYVYPNGEWYKTASFLLFSDQSHIFYLPQKAEKHKNYFKLISSDKVTKSDFQEYQLRDMQWLFDNNIVIESKDGYIKFVDIILVFILKELYYHEVLNYWRYPLQVRNAIDELSGKDILMFESSLFSRNEQDYLDYYLNKSKFTNGLDLRNKYLHGTNTNMEKQIQIDYFKILKLIIIIVLKINDDLCIKEDLQTLHESPTL